MVAQAEKKVTRGLTIIGETSAPAETSEELRAAYRESFEVLAGQGFCVYGHYPWDAWEKMALARGVGPELANLGRAVMREADQHRWSERLRSLCGWNDEGGRMIALALRAPETARRRWGWLLESDGQQVDPTRGYEWVGEDGWGWDRRRREWLKTRRA